MMLGVIVTVLAIFSGGGCGGGVLPTVQGADVNVSAAVVPGNVSAIVDTVSKVMHTENSNIDAAKTSSNAAVDRGHRSYDDTVSAAAAVKTGGNMIKYLFVVG